MSRTHIVLVGLAEGAAKAVPWVPGSLEKLSEVRNAIVEPNRDKCKGAVSAGTRLRCEVPRYATA
jgi:hypothetical protein